MKLIKILYSNHRPEVVPIMEKHIDGCDVMVTEDAPSVDFQQMLTGGLSIEEYLRMTDIEYPDFGKKTCLLWRRMHAAGVPVLQIEPFLERLLQIHERFASGSVPEDIEKEPLHHQVYAAERDATGALIEFYQSASDGQFDAIIEATIRFARLDARRFVLRDRLRAGAIRSLIERYSSIGVEAGQMHVALAPFLRQLLPAGTRVTSVQLMKPIVSLWGRSRHLFGPGDLLTLQYIFHPNSKSPRLNLLAARALIYNKVIVKDELVPDHTDYPHTRDEIQSIDLVNRLTLSDCRILYKKIGRVSTTAARTAVYQYLKQSDSMNQKAFSEPS